MIAIKYGFLFRDLDACRMLFFAPGVLHNPIKIMFMAWDYQPNEYSRRLLSVSYEGL